MSLIKKKHKAPDDSLFTSAFETTDLYASKSLSLFLSSSVASHWRQISNSYTCVVSALWRVGGALREHSGGLTAPALGCYYWELGTGETSQRRQNSSRFLKDKKEFLSLGFNPDRKEGWFVVRIADAKG